MEIKFENLERIEDIHKLQLLILDLIKNKNEKRWLDINETSKYICLSADRIHKLKNIEFFENKHYYKKSGKLLFDKNELDNWVMENKHQNENNSISNEFIKNLIGDLTKQVIK